MDKVSGWNKTKKQKSYTLLASSKSSRYRMTKKLKGKAYNVWVFVKMTRVPPISRSLRTVNWNEDAFGSSSVGFRIGEVGGSGGLTICWESSLNSSANGLGDVGSKAMEVSLQMADWASGATWGNIAAKSIRTFLLILWTDSLDRSKWFGDTHTLRGLQTAYHSIAHFLKSLSPKIYLRLLLLG